MPLASWSAFSGGLNEVFFQSPTGGARVDCPVELETSVKEDNLTGTCTIGGSSSTGLAIRGRYKITSAEIII